MVTRLGPFLPVFSYVDNNVANELCTVDMMPHLTNFELSQV
jgi:hypothetical protein